jgi:hypothetical protein
MRQLIEVIPESAIDTRRPVALWNLSRDDDQASGLWNRLS